MARGRNWSRMNSLVNGARLYGLHSLPSQQSTSHSVKAAECLKIRTHCSFVLLQY